MSPITINEILAYKTSQVRAHQERLPLERLKADVARVAASQPTRGFHQALVGRVFSVIAEIKRRSPAQGDIHRGLNVEDVARLYDDCDPIAALSVLTDDRFFGGSPDDLKAARAVAHKPVLRKDFIIDEYQIYEARLWGADAILLIASILSRAQLADFIDLAHALAMEALIECHTRDDLDNIPMDRARLIGFNSRDLMGDMRVDLGIFERLIGTVPNDKVTVAESGIKTPEQLKWVKDLGYRAALIGAGILTTDPIDQGLRDLLRGIECNPPGTS